MNKIIPSVIEDNGEYYIHIEEYKTLKELLEHYEHLYSEVKKQKDDVVEYIKKHIQEYDVDGSPTNLDEFDFLASPKILLRMLGEENV